MGHSKNVRAHRKVYRTSIRGGFQMTSIEVLLGNVCVPKGARIGHWRHCHRHGGVTVITVTVAANFSARF